MGATKRKLSDEEVKVTKNNIARQKEEVERLQYLIDESTLKIDRGLRITFEEKRKEYVAARVRWKNELDEKLKIISVAEDQLKNGVEVKE